MDFVQKCSTQTHLKINR